MSPQENAVRIGKELGLCPEAAAPFGVQLLPSLNRKSFNRRSMEEKQQQDAPYEQYYGTSP